MAAMTGQPRSRPMTTTQVAKYVARRQPKCKDCKAELAGGYTSKLPRPAPHPGPRCATHHRARKQAVQAVAHEQRVTSTYGLANGDYAKLYDYQGQRCAICRRAKGLKRRLAVDHHHGTGEVRGLLCVRCNQMIGHLRDSPEAFRRAAAYLEHPPARRLAAREAVTL